MEDHPAYVPLPESAFRAMRHLDADQVADLMDMLYLYAFEGEEPKGDGAAAAMFEVIRPLLEVRDER